ncbi:BEL1-like homeodomain-containing protein [Cinnamomum micranthum f. kanehirae]|uniref:BEL1-like homeodomain-containing protein n=1 Tax=Cinnamomum micranthum f. kanehirae TaxID=337451 RepID=A0A3S3MKU7_9MAGN|nr:BEL1-like homeodomain-containing protein [Cinnamomum micranthum f. kanehirae]
MATYYNTSNQRDAIPTLYLGDPGHASYHESSLTGSMMYLNYSSAGSYSDHLAGNSQPQQNCVQLPVPTTMLSQDSSVGPSESTASHQVIPSNLVSPGLGEHSFGVWHDGRNETFFQAINQQINNNTDDHVSHSVTEEPQMDIQSQLGVLQREQSLQSQRPNVSAIQGQGLSLSLSTQIPSTIQAASFQYHQHTNAEISFMGSHQSILGAGGSCREDGSLNKESRNAELPPYSGGDHAITGGMLGSNLQYSAALKQMHRDCSPYGFSALSSTIPNSKYLKAVQQLLDEVVNVKKALKQDSDKHQSIHTSAGMPGSRKNDVGSISGALPPSEGMPANHLDSTSSSTNDLSPAERQDLQTKMTKLTAMLDEVDIRYRQYHHQMQSVVSSFDVIAGCGAAKPYTALALQTISRHFRCLRDAISNQIKVARKSLGEEDNASGKGGGISRLRFVDQQLRQQRALQQFGVIQQHAWRPQRGLPENSVSILRAWLFEHFLHPYPKDSDKIMLARQTGLTRSQVSNWFINARVRLWKPMVEEMYKEEIGDAEMDSNSSSDNATKVREEMKSSDNREEIQSMKSADEKCPISQYSDSKKSDNVSDVEMAVTTPGFQNGVNNEDHCSLLQDALIQPDGNGRFMAYQMAELGRFGNGGVSLTLGLQHCDGDLPVSGGQQNFVSVRGGDDDMYGATPDRVDAAEYDCMNLGNQRHRFSSSQLLNV